MVSMVSNLFHAVYYIYHILISMVHTCNDHCSYYLFYTNFIIIQITINLHFLGYYIYIFIAYSIYNIIKLQHNYSFCNQFINQKRKLEFTLSFIYIKLKNEKS